MKKIAVIFTLLTYLGTSAVSLAETNSNIKIAILQDVMKDVLKQTIYDIGTRALNKYAGTSSSTYTYTPSPPAVAPVAPAVAAPPVVATPQIPVVPAQEQPTEKMIPVS